MIRPNIVITIIIFNLWYRTPFPRESKINSANRFGVTVSIGEMTKTAQKQNGPRECRKRPTSRPKRPRQWSKKRAWRKQTWPKRPKTKMAYGDVENGSCGFYSWKKLQVCMFRVWWEL